MHDWNSSDRAFEAFRLKLKQDHITDPFDGWHPCSVDCTDCKEDLRIRMEEVLLASVRAQHGPTAIKLAHEPRVRQWLSAAELQELQIAENRYRQHFMEELSFRPVEEPMSSVPESVHQSTKVDFAQGSKPPALAGFEDWSFLGKGGMAEVWRGRDRKTGRVEAVKIAFAIDPETIRRFQLEARSMATIDHRNVRRVYGADVAPTAGRISAWSFWPVPL